MASTFKTLLNNDVTSTRTMLHEAIPLTGTIVSGTYTNSDGDEYNIKNYTHGMFQSVYDYPYLSSSANHILDLTVGYSSNSGLSSSTSVQNAKKINVYTQMAQILVGYDATGSIRDFDRDGDFTGGAKLKEVVFINFSRLLQKDEIKKESFSMTFATGSTCLAPTEPLILQDLSALSAYKTNSPAGEYGLLYSGSATGGSEGPTATTSDVPAGLIYYQAGIAVVTASIFSGSSADGTACFGSPGEDPRYVLASGDNQAGLVAGETIVDSVLTGSEISGACNGVRNRLMNISFNNTTELNSTIYFCRVNNSEFNYSSNPTYTTGSQIRVKNNATDSPVSYITTVGLYSANNELLAVAKISEPLKKSPDNEFTLRVRLDY